MPKRGGLGRIYKEELDLDDVYANAMEAVKNLTNTKDTLRMMGYIEQDFRALSINLPSNYNSVKAKFEKVHEECKKMMSTCTEMIYELQKKLNTNLSKFTSWTSQVISKKDFVKLFKENGVKNIHLKKWMTDEYGKFEGSYVNDAKATLADVFAAKSWYCVTDSDTRTLFKDYCYETLPPKVLKYMPEY